MQAVDKPTQISQFSLTTLLWLMAVVAAFLGGKEMQRGRDQHWWSYVKPEPTTNDFSVVVAAEPLDGKRLTTTVTWADGKSATFSGGKLPDWTPEWIREEATGVSAPYYRTTAEDRRRIEADYSLPSGVLER